MNTATFSLSIAARAGIFAILALVMLATRINHFGALPDASWAVFFVAGFYLYGNFSDRSATTRPLLRGLLNSSWAFALLMALAVLIDFFVITRQGIDFWSHYCVSPAYLFLLPSYAAPWLGGVWLRVHYRGVRAREAGLLVASAIVAASVCFLISNGSFYWLSANVPLRSFAGWMENLGDWYVPYLRTTLMYVGIGAVLHVTTVLAAKAWPKSTNDFARR
ncbi:MAG: hypothetical protein ABJB02_00255 [Dokdonella sp.]